MIWPPAMSGPASLRGGIEGVAAVDPASLPLIPLADIEKVRFYKRDELTSDLICCEIDTGNVTQIFHEEMAGWDSLVRHLEGLQGFRTDWFAAVSQPAFEASETIAFMRSR